MYCAQARENYLTVLTVRVPLCSAQYTRKLFNGFNRHSSSESYSEGTCAVFVLIILLRKNLCRIMYFIPTTRYGVPVPPAQGTCRVPVQYDPVPRTGTVPVDASRKRGKQERKTTRQRTGRPWRNRFALRPTLKQQPA